MNIITDRLPPRLDKNYWVGIDLEVFDLNQKQMHRPTSGRFALLSIAVGDDVYVIDDERKVAQALSQIREAWWVIQNAKFDIVHLRRWADVPPRARLWDTMLIDRILWGGYYDSFSLGDLARRYLYTHLEKELQKSFVGSRITGEQLMYSAVDAWVLPQIAEAQKKHVKRKDFAIWNEIDRPALFAFLDFPGFAIDIKAWEQLAIRNKARQEEIDAALPINPRAPQQVKRYLSERGFVVKSTGKDVLEELLEKGKLDDETADVVSNILKSRMYSTWANRYGMSFISEFLEYDNGVPVIVANYWAIGADTGRTSSDDPNMQNIPVRETNEFRNCFIARPGHKLIVADYNQQEIVIGAFISGDDVLIDICNSGQDIYIMMAKEMFGKEITKHDPLRTLVKTVVLGLNYGMSEYGLSKRLNISTEEAKEIIHLFRSRFRRFGEWMDRQQSLRDFVETVAGRRYWLNPYNSKSARNALNSPIQGSAGDCMKKALGRLHKEWHSITPVNFGVVGYIHDELVLDVPAQYADKIAKAVEDIMIGTANEMFPGMRFRAETVIGDSWACKS